DIERLDLDLLDHLGRARSRRACTVIQRERWLRVRLTFQPLKRPGAALLDAERNRGQRHNPADIVEVALIGEAGQVVLDAVVPGHQRCGALQPDGAIGRDEAATGSGGARLGDKDAKRQQDGDQLPESASDADHAGSPFRECVCVLVFSGRMAWLTLTHGERFPLLLRPWDSSERIVRQFSFWNQSERIVRVFRAIDLCPGAGLLASGLCASPNPVLPANSDTARYSEQSPLPASLHRRARRARLREMKDAAA